ACINGCSHAPAAETFLFYRVPLHGRVGAVIPIEECIPLPSLEVLLDLRVLPCLHDRGMGSLDCSFRNRFASLALRVLFLCAPNLPSHVPKAAFGHRSTL